jgi:hypothetical protein
MPPDDDLQRKSIQLHQLLASGDPTAAARLAEIHIPLLVRRLSERYPPVKYNHLVETAAHDAFLNYIKRPQQYDPSKLPLDRYLLMSASSDFLNSLKTIRRENERSHQFVELDALDAEQEIGDDRGLSVEDEILVRTSSLWGVLATQVTDPVDQEIVMLMLDNERSAAEYALVLGITHLPLDEQAREVKRNKDRLKKQLQRHIRRTDLDNYE